MATRVTDGARWERHEKRVFFISGCRPRFARLAASPLARACTPLTKSEEKERLLAVYTILGSLSKGVFERHTSTGSEVFFILKHLKAAVSRNSAKLGNYKMTVKLRET